MAHPKSVVLHPQRDTAQGCDLLAKALGAACKQGADSPGQNAASLGCIHAYKPEGSETERLRGKAGG